MKDKDKKKTEKQIEKELNAVKKLKQQREQMFLNKKRKRMKFISIIIKKFIN